MVLQQLVMNQVNTAGPDKSLIDDIIQLIKEAEECTRTARRNRVSLKGSNYYANKFLELSTRATILTGKLRRNLAGTENQKAVDAAAEIGARFEELFDIEADAGDRSDSAKQIVVLLRTAVEPALSLAVSSPPSDRLFPLELVRGTRGYVEIVAAEACGCYDQGWYDASLVMIRRLLETLIIECYEHHQLESKIKDGDGNFLFLRDLVTRFLSEAAWNPSRNVRRGLPKLKDVGDLSAHSRRFTAKNADVETIRADLRVIVEELVHIAGLRARDQSS